MRVIKSELRHKQPYLTFFLRIAKLYLTILALYQDKYINSQFFSLSLYKKSELLNNCFIRSHNSDFIPRNCEYTSCNSDVISCKRLSLAISKREKISREKRPLCEIKTRKYLFSMDCLLAYLILKIILFFYFTSMSWLSFCLHNLGNENIIISDFQCFLLNWDRPYFIP